MTFSLSNRLKVALKLLPKATGFLDIGADRGYLAITYKSICNKINVYASENKKGPYSTLLKTINNNNSNVIPLYGDGLDILPSDVDTIALLGMGGLTINKILNENIQKLDQIKYILISPQSSIQETIKNLNKIGYKNIKGKYILETRYYPILLYKKGKEKLNDLESFFGKVPFNNKDNSLKKYVDNEIKRYASFGYKLTGENLLIYNIFIHAKEILSKNEIGRRE